MEYSAQSCIALVTEEGIDLRSLFDFQFWKINFLNSILFYQVAQMFENLDFFWCSKVLILINITLSVSLEFLSFFPTGQVNTSCPPQWICPKMTLSLLKMTDCPCLLHISLTSRLPARTMTWGLCRQTPAPGLKLKSVIQQIGKIILQGWKTVTCNHTLFCA